MNLVLLSVASCIHSTNTVHVEGWNLFYLKRKTLNVMKRPEPQFFPRVFLAGLD